MWVQKKTVKKQLQIIDDVTNKTKNNTGTSINLMFNYGSREEINDAIQKLDGKKLTSMILESTFI